MYDIYEETDKEEKQAWGFKEWLLVLLGLFFVVVGIGATVGFLFLKFWG